VPAHDGIVERVENAIAVAKTAQITMAAPSSHRHANLAACHPVAEAAAGAKLLWKIPNQYFAVSTAIDRGIPLMQQNHTDIARAFTGLASRLTENDSDVKRTAWSLFKTV